MQDHIVVLTGAGISAESGLSTFRDNGGLWEQHSVYDVATPEAFARNQELVLRFYNDRRRQLASAQPNRAHQLLAELEQRYRVTVVTQNVDDLHERGGASNVIHLHGELTRRAVQNIRSWFMTSVIVILTLATPATVAPSFVLILSGLARKCPCWTRLPKLSARPITC